MTDRRHAVPERPPADGRLPRARWAAGIAVLAAVGVAATGRDAPRAAPAAMARALARPAVLPAAWAGYAAARDAGDPAAAAAALEAIVAVIPEWTDGHVALAWTTALEIATDDADPTARLALLLDALGRLDAAARTTVAAHPSRAAELWLSAAALAEIRTTQDAPVHAAWLARFAATAEPTPLDTARRLVASAADAVRDAAVDRRLAFVTQRSVAAVIHGGDLARAEAVRLSAIGRLEALPQSEERDTALAALRRLGELTRFGPGGRDPAELAGDPDLADVRRALEEAARR